MLHQNTTIGLSQCSHSLNNERCSVLTCYVTDGSVQEEMEKIGIDLCSAVGQCRLFEISLHLISLIQNR